MKNRKRGYAASLLTLLVLLGVCFAVFHDKLPDILNAMRAVPGGRIALILCAGMAYQLLDTAMCLVLVRTRLPALRYGQAFMLTMTGVFGMVCSNSAVTIPLQSLYLHTLGLDVGHTVGLMVLKYIFHKSTIFLFALHLLLFQLQWLAAGVPHVTAYLIPGFVMCFLVIALLVLLCTWDRLRTLLDRLLDKLPDKGRWGEKKDVWHRNIGLMYTEMQFLMQKKGHIAAVLSLNAAKLALVYTVPLLCLRALGCQALNVPQGMLLCALVWLLAGVLPNVSGLGPAEVAFSLLFGAFAGESTVSAALLLYRAATYFTPFVCSLPAVLCMQRRIKGAMDSRGGDAAGLQ